MKQKVQGKFRNLIGLVAVAVLCLLPAFSVAGQANTPGSRFLAQKTETLSLLHLDQQRSGLAFDLGGSETRKLALQLSRPLTLSVSDSRQKSSSGVGSVFLDSSLNFAVNDSLDITASLGAGKSQASFQPLGSIYCQNGVLDRGSYRASDCHFINQANVLKQDQVAMGLRYGDKNLSTALGMFQRKMEVNQTGIAGLATPMAGSVMNAGLLTPLQANPLLSSFNLGQPLNYLNAETTGLDLEFQVGLRMDSAGEVKLGLQFTRVLDASFETGLGFSGGVQNWVIASPFDSARLSLDWSKGNFSSGIQSFYREQVKFLGRDNLESLATFDVYFTWRAPWNANLSVGTANILNAGADENGSNDTNPQDPFESIYGRIPYVRYQQDL